MCVKPKRIEIKDTGHFIFVPCGKCLECQNQSRAEWVLRCKTELNDNPYAYFVTLTYKPENMPADYLDDDERKHLLLDIKLGLKKDFSDFLLRKEDLSTFLKSLQLAYQKTYFPIQYKDVDGVRSQLSLARKEHNVELICRCKEYLKSHPLPRFRHMSTGEYGTLSHHPHYHLLLFFPQPITQLDLESLCKKCWSYGKIEVDKPNSDTAVFNYVSKHQIKEDKGTAFQNSVAPIFKLSTTYKGGIGYSLRNDRDIQLKYSKRDDGIQQTIELPFDTDLNVFPFPRYVKKFLHPQNLSLLELSKLEADSTARVVSMLSSAGFNVEPDSDAYIDAIRQVFHKNSVADYQKKCSYFKSKYINKLIKNKKYNGR